MFYEATFRIGAGEAGLNLQCRPSGVLSILQEGATQAACQFHASGPEMREKHNALWMVTRMWYRLDRPLMWGDEVKLRTWHRGGRGPSMYRDFDLFVDGKPIGEAVSVWVLVNAEDRKLLRLSDVSELAVTGGGELCKSKKLSGLRLPGDMALVERRRFHYSDIDCNGHVNNVRYADLAADAAGLEARLDSQFVSSLQIGYLKECMAGESIDVLKAESGDGVYILGAGQGGDTRFDALLTLDNLP